MFKCQQGVSLWIFEDFMIAACYDIQMTLITQLSEVIKAEERRGYCLF